MPSEELRYSEYSYHGEDVIYFSGKSIKEVDGIPTAKPGVYSNLMFNIKDDATQEEELLQDSDGYLDDSKEYANWDSPYMPLPYEYGDIDEEAWLKESRIIGTS